MAFNRLYSKALELRVSEGQNRIQVLLGPRQVGKTTLVRQMLAAQSKQKPCFYLNADETPTPNFTWITTAWAAARAGMAQAGATQAIIVFDEIQQVPDWSRAIKGQWDKDQFDGRDIRVVLLGSASLLMQQGLTESMMGRYEILRIPHWSFAEMQAAFGTSLDDFMALGGYPGLASMQADVPRYLATVRDAFVEPMLARDILAMVRVDKPVLLRRLLHLGACYSGQILSYTKIMADLIDAGNTVTLAHYADLLEAAGLLSGLNQHGRALGARRSQPKWQVHNNAVLSAYSQALPAARKADSAAWGRQVESAVGAQLNSWCFAMGVPLTYWREANQEVDFVLAHNGQVLAHSVQRGLVPAASAYAPTQAIEFVHCPAMVLVVRQLMAALRWNGVAHIDLRYDTRSGRMNVIEINPRFWLTVVGSALAAHVNFPVLACRAALGRPVPTPLAVPGRYIPFANFLQYKYGRRRGEKIPFALADTSVANFLGDPLPKLFYLLRRRQVHIE